METDELEEIAVRLEQAAGQVRRARRIREALANRDGHGALSSAVATAQEAVRRLRGDRRTRATDRPPADITTCGRWAS